MQGICCASSVLFRRGVCLDPRSLRLQEIANVEHCKRVVGWPRGHGGAVGFDGREGHDGHHACAGFAEDDRWHDGFAEHADARLGSSFHDRIVVYGITIAALAHRMDASPTVIGIIIGVVGWLIMMVMVMLMPMAGVGMFAMSMGVMAPMMTLILHLIFGAVLGWTYGKLVSDGPAAHTVRA